MIRNTIKHYLDNEKISNILTQIITYYQNTLTIVSKILNVLRYMKNLVNIWKCSRLCSGKFHLRIYQKYIQVYPRYTKIYQDIRNTKRRRGRPARPGPGAGPGPARGAGAGPVHECTCIAPAGAMQGTLMYPTCVPTQFFCCKNRHLVIYPEFWVYTQVVLGIYPEFWVYIPRYLGIPMF